MNIEISPQQISESAASQLFHSIPVRHLTFDDFVGPAIMGQIVYQIHTSGPNSDKVAPGIHSAAHGPFGALPGPHGLLSPYAEAAAMAPEQMETFLSSLREHAAMKLAMEWYDDTYGKNAIHRRVRTSTRCTPHILTLTPS